MTLLDTSQAHSRGWRLVREDLGLRSLRASSPLPSDSNPSEESTGAQRSGIRLQILQQAPRLFQQLLDQVGMPRLDFELLTGLIVVCVPCAPTASP